MMVTVMMTMTMMMLILALALGRLAASLRARSGPGHKCAPLDTRVSHRHRRYRIGYAGDVVI